MEWSDDEVRDWTETSIPTRFPSSRIKQFDFSAENSDDDEATFFWSRKGFNAAAGRLLEFVDQEGFVAADRQIVFISHGFGGVLVKGALIRACYQAKYAFIPAITRGLVFFTTPHRVASSETWEDVVFQMLYDVFHEDRTKPWRISKLANILAKIQVDYALLAESWPTINVYSKAYDHRESAVSRSEHALKEFRSLI